MKLWISLVTLSVALKNGFATKVSPIKVSLRSSWPAPPLLLEIAETIAIENEDAIFPFLEALNSPEHNPAAHTLRSEAAYHYALELASSHGYIPDPISFASVELNLALHAATPKIEAFYQYYTDHYEERSEEKKCGGSWVDWYGEVVCDRVTLEMVATKVPIEQSGAAESTTSRPKLLTFDHIHPSPSSTLTRPLHTAILYASIDSPNFWELHSFLFAHAQRKPEPLFEYVLRYIPPATQSAERNHLTGYGVSLDLKKMDYLVLDDRHGIHQGNVDVTEADAESAVVTDPIWTLLDKYPENNLDNLTAPLDAEELLEIGIQASQLLRDSDAPLKTLTHLSQNFPAYAPMVARRVHVDEALREEVQENLMKVQGGFSLMWLNGVPLKDTDISPFGIVRLLRKEKNVMNSLKNLGLSNAQAVDLISHQVIAASQSSNAAIEGLFDASDRVEGEGALVWWNDFEKDSRYAKWQPSIKGLLRPLYPGQFHNIRLNLFNIILSLDLSQSSSLNFIAGPVSNIISRNFPFRWGVVPSVETVDGTRMARLFYWLVDHYGRAKTMSFLKQVSQVHVPQHLLPVSLDWDIVRSEFDALVVQESENLETDVPLVDFDAIVSESSEVGEQVEKARKYARRLGLDLASAPQGHAFVNGKHFDMDDNFLRHMQGEASQQLQFLQAQLYEGMIIEDIPANMSTYFYDLPTTSLRRNKHIHPAPGTLRVVDLTELSSRAGLGDVPSSFVYAQESEDIPLSIHVIADLDSDAGLALVKEALTYLLFSQSLARVTFVHNPSQPYTDPTAKVPLVSGFISHIISEGLLSKFSPGQLLRALGLEPAVTAGEHSQIVFSLGGDATDEIMSGIKMDAIDPKVYTDYERASRLVAKQLGLAGGEHALLVNGRVVGPFPPGELVAEDLSALEAYEMQKRVGPVMQAVRDVLPEDAITDRTEFAHIVSVASSLIWSIQLPDPGENGLFEAPPKTRVRNYRLLGQNHTVFKVGDNETALFHFGVLLDPVSEVAQKWSPLIEWLADLPDVFLELHLGPAPYSEIPVKRFYRYNVHPRLTFDEEGLEIPAQTVFDGIPVEPLYTMGMDVPQPWLVRPRAAPYDLDNLQLGALSPSERARGVEVLFELDYLVVEGHAREAPSNAPPRGLQLALTDGHNNAIADTQVVANLGYIQFKARPGVFQLGIRAGRGQDVFEMQSAGGAGWMSPSLEEVGNDVAVTSFEGLTLYPRFVRRDGMEDEDVLADLRRPEPGHESLVQNVVSRVTSLFKPKEEPVKELVVSGSPQADINIFTVASGLLYERFASIMILSVMRNTKSSVKFWFIENFLSPSFLEFIPHLAEAYNFQYELVTYKWPSFIRPQKEKQRIIWAYKILFLDVLFPMDLTKVIFVDADQIVRADLRELVELDLHGAPYAYTPMGDDNTDMEGFRFWKTGYWRNFLQGRPYHISALYVVDLVRFRQMAAGDILRGQYQQLSADPNSLANLDQDLPNNLQGEVPIFSLHEDWLWCETWCSKDRLHRAKTIDLCQNPLTKEPKLSRARQIPEWEEYDTEIARFAGRLAEEGKIQSAAAAADANDLASVGASAVAVEESKEGATHERDEL